ncbi:nucleotide-binding protein [Pseudomonas sp. MWU16-30317]|uniref:TIR domain-containing protein n=1 Tax=Pseudomonas sp. MWU16-30317 TaxID=2878095 RepID=UPI001CFB50E6|nr:nucleotide-binding protein [Pseudomonas sp. MWU16-30317]
MPSKRPNSQSDTLKLIRSKDEVKTKIEERIEKGLELKQRQVDTRESFEILTNDYSKWDSFNTELLKQSFNTNEISKEYSFWGVAAIALREPSLGEKIASTYKDIDRKINRLDSISERLELIPLDDTLKDTTKSSKDSFNLKTSKSNKVFIVHGKDEISKTNLEVFLHEIGLEPVVLHRQADEGMTIIEKFEKHSDVGYAFILLTPDEIAYLVSEDTFPDDNRKKEYRARPNVIFEFGYFVGKLGRSRVCCLHTGHTALPSDVNGMVYKRFEKSIEEISYSIIKDLKASGYNFS